MMSCTPATTVLVAPKYRPVASTLVRRPRLELQGGLPDILFRITRLYRLTLTLRLVALTLHLVALTLYLPAFTLHFGLAVETFFDD